MVFHFFIYLCARISILQQIIMLQFVTLELLLNRPRGYGDTWNLKIKDKAMQLLFPESKLYKLDPNSEPHRGPLPKHINNLNKQLTCKLPKTLTPVSPSE